MMTLPRILFALALASTAIHAEIEVSVELGTPLASLQAARDKVRALRKAGQTGHATIYVEGGTYEQAQALTLDVQDSDLTIRAVKEGKPLLMGAPIVTGFTPHEGKIVKADVSKLVAKGAKYHQVLQDNERMILARWPNFDAKDPLYGGWAFVDDIPKAVVEQHQWKSEMYLKPQDVRTWAHPEDVELDIFAMYGWWNFIEHVKSVDATTRKVTLTKPCSYDLHPHNRFHFQNALEELDAPGEWFLDPRTNTIYVWPTGNEDITKHEIRLVTLDSFIKLTPGAKNVMVRGLCFTGNNGTSVTMTNTTGCTVAACVFKNVGDFSGSAISISGGTDNAARGNDISYTGSNGISLGGGDHKTLTACNNIADNNQIHHIGVFNKNACGVGATGVGITISHNLIHDGPRMGVQMGGNNITVEYNHMHHLLQETQDGGAIYTGGRDWISSRGSKWQYNRIHDIIGCGQEADGLHHPWFSFGLYPDDNTGGVDMIGNLVYRCEWTPIHMHNSRDCIVENNIFALGNKFQFDLHGWTKDQRFYTDHLPTMIKGYESVINEPAWKGMRNMDLHPKDAIRDDGTMMSGDIVRRNIMYSSTPGVKYGDTRNVTPKWNTIDENLAWNGEYPVVTGINKVGPDKGEPLLVESFANAEAGKTPPGWGFNSRPKGVNLTVVDGTLRADCGPKIDPKNSHTTFQSPELPIKPGAAYRAKLRIRGSEPTSRVGLALAIFVNKMGYWQTSGTTIQVTDQWQEVETTGRMLLETDANWKPWMKKFWLRVDCHNETGQIFLDDVRITEAEPLNEWTAWQAAGWDKNSIVADPLFVDVAKDDFRLKPESPAIQKLGFKPLPIDQMGLYKDELRATWPVK